jgi:hypothetical protein
MMILMAMLLAGAEPTVEAMALGRELAEQGTLTGLLTLLEVKETDDLVKEHPELSAAEQAALRKSAHRTFRTGFAKVMNESAKGYVERLSIEELRALVSFNRSPAAVHYRTISPAVIAKTMQTLGPMDFKGDVIANYCKETGKLCGR